MTALPWANGAIDPSYVPKTGNEFMACLSSKRWRMYSGMVYQILVKENEDDDEGLTVPFKPNEYQTELYFALEDHPRATILKARQLGFTTGLAIEFFDHALWNDDQRCLMIAQSNTDMETIFRDKILYAYDRLPNFVRPLKPFNKRTERLLELGNNSNLRVALSGRSGTFQRLHVSEYGKISAQTPKRAKEIVSGAIPALVPGGIGVVESTAEGRGGEFFKLSERARIRAQDLAPLRPKEWKFMFYPWWRGKDNTVDPDGVAVSAEDHKYFDEVEVAMETLLDNGQRAWYVLTRREDFSDDTEIMWREHPSTPEEAWQQSSEGHYYSKQLATSRRNGRIGVYKAITSVPVMGVWDIGHTDGTGVWLFQYINGYVRLVGYIQGWEEDYGHYARQLQDTGYVLGKQFLPHDANNAIMGKTSVTSAYKMLSELLPNLQFQVVPRTPTKQLQIDLVRKYFALFQFDKEGCKEGIEHLENYQKVWNTTRAVFDDTPLKNDSTEAADGIGVLAQAIDLQMLTASKSTRRQRPSARTL